ncbi:MAG: ATP synthase F1 subunit delta [Armatimonadetes bacterium RBG_16_58_9]|nr:MAG: ATP synthase F1 subunit delta [Armatimonadetes bacterium RBG_16_58_9]
MIERRIVRRYASALFASAVKADVVDRVESDLGLVGYAMETSPELFEAIRSPLVPDQAKRDILGRVFEGKVHELTLSYLNLLIDKGREEAAAQTEQEYILLANEARGIVTAQLVSAVQLTDDEEAGVKTALARVTGKTVDLEKRVDPEIIGGAIVRIADSVIDGSITGQLRALREQLLG